MPKLLTTADIEAFRERLCDIAEGLFAERGPVAVTMRDLADLMGVSPMTPYRYFTDKDAILAAVRARAFDRFASHMEASLAASEAGRQASGTGSRAYIDFAFSEPAAYRLMFDTNQPTAEAYPELRRAMERARATMTAGWRRLQAQGLIEGDIETLGHVCWSAMHGPIMLELAGLLSPPLDGRALAMKAMEALEAVYGLSGARRKD